MVIDTTYLTPVGAARRSGEPCPGPPEQFLDRPSEIPCHEAVNYGVDGGVGVSQKTAVGDENIVLPDDLCVAQKGKDGMRQPARSE